MPIFFFDIESEEILARRIEAAFPNLQLAEEYARGLAETMMAGAVSQVRPWRVSIQTRSGKVVQVVTPEAE